jgi:hypothetical protein
MAEITLTPEQLAKLRDALRAIETELNTLTGQAGWKPAYVISTNVAIMRGLLTPDAFRNSN